MHQSKEATGGYFETHRAVIDKAARDAVISALAAQKSACVPAATMDNGHVSIVPPEQLLTSTYHHERNAGNIGDVFKHACLVSYFSSVAETEDKAPLAYVESHAGSARYAWERLRNQSNSWSDQRAWSLEPLLELDWRSAGLRRLKEIVRDPSQQRYPGSAELALLLLPGQTEFRFYDLSVDAVRSIDKLAMALRRESHVSAHWSDGFHAVQQTLRRAKSPPRRTLIFVDPPFREETRAADRDSVQAAFTLAVGHPSETLLCWYPITSTASSPPSLGEEFARAFRGAVSWTELWLNGLQRNTRWLRGCGLLWANADGFGAIATDIAADLQAAFRGSEIAGRKLTIEFRSSE